MVDLSRVGCGCPDILVYNARLGRLYLLEIKERRGVLTPSQEAFKALFPVAEVRGVRQALEACGVEVAT